jgi:hypothetical protein
MTYRQASPTPQATFGYANKHLLAAILKTSDSREVHASDDIFSVSGVKLWARGKPVTSQLVQRLAGIHVRKPVELCIYCNDPGSESAVQDTVDRLLAENDALRRLVSPHVDAIREAVRHAIPDPVELLLISVLRFGSREIFTHAVIVMMVTVAPTAASRYSPPRAATRARRAAA